MPYCFRCQTHVTALDVGFNVVSQEWLKVFLRQKLTSHFDTKMASQQVVVMPADELHPHGLGHKK